jgi:FtsH-binding integral membrane protein
MSKKTLFLILLGVLASPSIVFAQLTYGYSQNYSYLDILDTFMGNLWILFTAIAVICFAIAGITFLTANGDPEKLKLARSAFIWGIVGVVIGIIAGSIISIVGSFAVPPPPAVIITVP